MNDLYPLPGEKKNKLLEKFCASRIVSYNYHRTKLSKWKCKRNIAAVVGKEQVASLAVRRLAFLRAWVSRLIVNFSVCDSETFLAATAFIRSFRDTGSLVSN